MVNIKQYLQCQPKLGNGVYVHPTATIIGDVEIGEDSSIWPTVVIRGDVNQIRIGQRTNIQDGTIIHVDHNSARYTIGSQAIIGDEVTIGHKVMLHGCTIHDRALIGIGSIILDHAVIESEVLLGAGSLVPGGKILESGYLWLGSPVRKIRALTAEEREFFKYSADNYVDYKNAYLALELT